MESVDITPYAIIPGMEHFDTLTNCQLPIKMLPYRT